MRYILENDTLRVEIESFGAEIKSVKRKADGREYMWCGDPVFYSLGNFIFGQSIDRSAMLEVTIDAAGRASYRFVPVYAAGGVTYPAEGGQAESVLNYLDGISEAAVASDGTVTED